MTEAGGGLITLLGRDEVAVPGSISQAREGWFVKPAKALALAEGRDHCAAALLGYYATEADADTARARQFAEAGDR